MCGIRGIHISPLDQSLILQQNGKFGLVCKTHATGGKDTRSKPWHWIKVSYRYI
jgi:hypothetical protein